MGKRASAIAFVAAALHAVATAMMLTVLRPGLPGGQDRIGYIASHRAGWTAGWIVWMLAAASFLLLMSVLARRFGRRPVIAICALAFVIDVSCEVRYIRELPRVRGEELAALDRQLTTLIGGVANGLYTLAFALILAAGWRLLPRAFGVVTVIAGVALALASLLNATMMVMIATAILFPVLIAWMIQTGRWLRAPAGLPGGSRRVCAETNDRLKTALSEPRMRKAQIHELL